MKELNASVSVVEGVSKKTGKPYRALKVEIPGVDGGVLRFMIFPRPLEWRLMGYHNEK